LGDYAQSAVCPFPTAIKGGNRKKVVVNKSALKARACKRLADANVPFCGKEEQGSGTKNP
jgi:hypothetical protein